MTSTSVTERGTSWDVNRRAVYHSVETGGGYEGLASFCSIMNMPCMTKTAYYKQESACWSIHKTGMPYKGQKTGQKLRCGSHRKGKEASEDRTTPACARRERKLYVQQRVLLMKQEHANLVIFYR